MMTKNKPRTSGWYVGRRVCRENSEKLGTITEARDNIKVKWDDGSTSYFNRTRASNIKLKLGRELCLEQR